MGGRDASIPDALTRSLGVLPVFGYRVPRRRVRLSLRGHEAAVTAAALMKYIEQVQGDDRFPEPARSLTVEALRAVLERLLE